MSEQQSQKRGIVSDAQKQDRAREGYDPLPASQPVAGAFGDLEGDTPTDQELALKMDEQKQRRRQ